MPFMIELFVDLLGIAIVIITQFALPQFGVGGDLKDHISKQLFDDTMKLKNLQGDASKGNGRTKVVIGNATLNIPQPRYQSRATCRPYLPRYVQKRLRRINAIRAEAAVRHGAGEISKDDYHNTLLQLEKFDINAIRAGESTPFSEIVRISGGRVALSQDYRNSDNAFAASARHAHLSFAGISSQDTGIGLMKISATILIIVVIIVLVHEAAVLINHGMLMNHN